MQDARLVQACGWEIKLSAGAPATPSALATSLFIDPDQPPAPGRGIIAAVALGPPGLPAALLAGWSEAFLAQAPTLGAAIAAARALDPFTSWAAAHGGEVSLAIIIASGREITLLCKGDFQIWGADEPLIEPGSEGLACNRVIPAVGERIRILPAAPPADYALSLEILARPATDPITQAGSLARLDFGPEPREGGLWDGYRLGRTLYRGPCTWLIEARDGLGRHLVLKIPRRGILEDEVFRNGFIREAWVGLSIKSPHVAEYLPPSSQNSLYLTLAFYRGETLEKHLGANPDLPIAEVVRLITLLCAAVEDLADAGILHCDLKPENVMIEPDGNLRLLDLGLACLPGRDGSAPRLGGTTLYMAHELFAGAKPSAVTEVFSLGVILFRLLTAGRFPGANPAQSLSRLRPDLPGWLRRITLQTLALDPAARVQNAGELARILAEGMRFGEPEAAERKVGFWRKIFSKR